MRLLAYYHPTQDPFQLRLDLLRMGWKQVAMRDGSLWREDSKPEPGWPSVCAFGYPGVLRAYAALGCEIIDPSAVDYRDLPPPPIEIETLPPATCVAVLNPGQHLMAELAAHPLPEGVVTIAVNEAARRVSCTWQLCNDGFAIAQVQGTIGEHGRITRRRFADTIPGGRWFALDRIGIVDGTFSTTCSLRCAAAMRATTVLLYGHDLVAGNGLDGMTGRWDPAQLSSCAHEVAAEIASLRAAGIRVVHVRMIDGAPVADDGTVPAAPPVEPTPPPRRKKGKQ